jgi:type VI secretion system secreted protein Hcp
MDKAATNLFAFSVADSSGKTVKIDFAQTATGQSGNPVYLQYELTNTLISGYSLISGGADPHMTLSLNFTKVTQKWVDYDAENKTATPSTAGYDLAAAKPV